MTKPPIALLLLAALSGCTLIHSHTQPTLATPAAWRTPPAAEDAQASAAQAFWQQYQDPVLDALVATALQANPDVAIAAANVEAYQAQLGASESAAWPQLTLGGESSRGKGGNYPATPTNAFSLGLMLSWELDLWGRLARASDAARAELLAQEAVQSGVYLSLAAAVAQSYFQLRQLDEQLRVTQQTLALREQSLALFQLRFDGGVISEVELAQVRSEYEQALGALPQIESQIAQTEHALSLLIGRNPGPIERGRPLAELNPPPLPALLPSAVLLRRPDVRAAEAALAAADARVDAARLAWFPRISLSGLLGVASNDLDQLIKRSSQVWYGAASLAQPLFDGGRIEADVALNEAQRKALVASYQKTVQGAFREVEDGLVTRQKLGEQLAAQGRQLAALRRYAELARLRYENGYTSYLEVIDADRTLFSAELAAANTQGLLLANSANLFRVLGGTWTETQRPPGT